MFRILLALAWLGSANLQNLAQTLPADGLWVGMCGSGHRQWLPVPHKPKPPLRECASGCHAVCRKPGKDLGRHPAG